MKARPSPMLLVMVLFTALVVTTVASSALADPSTAYSLRQSADEATPSATWIPSFLPYVSGSYAAATSTPTPTSPPSNDCARAPQLISPANGSKLDTLIPLLQVNRGVTTTGTKLYVKGYSDAALTQTAWSVYSTRMVTLWDFRPDFNLQPATTYYWRAWFVCGTDQGPYSATWTFTTGSGGSFLPAPVLVSPPDGAHLSGTTLDARWSPVPGTLEYLWEIDYPGPNPSGIVATGFSDSTQLTISWLQPNTEYVWHIRAGNSYAWGTDSQHWHVTLGSAVAQSIPVPAEVRPGADRRTTGSGGDVVLIRP